MSLPYGDATFDVVVCQFGVMFFPAKPGAFAEVHRVLRPGGQFLFNAWDRIEHNEFADVVTDAMRAMFPDDPPLFLRRTPHGYHDPEMIRADLRAAGVEPLEARSRAAAAHEPAVGYCQGTPLREEIEARGPGRLAEATDAATEAVAQRFGRTDLDSRISAWVVSTVR
jgi:SAM-dependent methyltransferase